MTVYIEIINIISILAHRVEIQHSGVCVFKRIIFLPFPAVFNRHKWIFTGFRRSVTCIGYNCTSDRYLVCIIYYSQIAIASCNSFQKGNKSK